MKKSLFILIWFLVFSNCQSISAQQSNDPGGAFFRSMIVPGWGHYYNDRDDWNRGKFHLATELAIIATYVGFQHQSSRLKSEIFTLARLRSGVDIKSRNRSFQIALSEYPTLDAYNNYQLQSRNWNRLLEVNNDNNWQWKSEKDRFKYGELRSRRDRIRNQLPALFSLMVVNRVISAISAYRRARYSERIVDVSLIPIGQDNGYNGAIAKITYRF